MPRKVEISLLKKMLADGKTFELTPEGYEKIVGRALPLTDDYLKYRSPVAKAAREEGFRIRIEKRAVIQRVIIFEKGKIK